MAGGDKVVVVTAADLLRRSTPDSKERSGKDPRQVEPSQAVGVYHSQRIGIYNAKHQILVVGDGNLSFSLSLASFLGGENIVATCYDSEALFREKYPSSAGNIRALRSLKAKVYFSIDATKLHEKKILLSRETPFDRIIFNFPHSGVEGSTQESIQSNQQLLHGYFVSASLIIHPRGQIHLTLRNTTFYQSWKLSEQAALADLTLVREEPFDIDMFVGYEVARTASGELMRQAPSTENAFINCFTLSKKHPRVLEMLGDDEQNPLKKRKRTKKKKKLSAAESSFDCGPCGVSCSSQARWNGHINSPKHSKNVKKAKQLKAQNSPKPAKKRQKNK